MKVTVEIPDELVSQMNAARAHLPRLAGFAGIQSPRVQMISRQQQFAEKIHAYTLPRNSQNSRAKDLVDMVLLVGSGVGTNRGLWTPCG